MALLASLMCLAASAGAQTNLIISQGATATTTGTFEDVLNTFAVQPDGSLKNLGSFHTGTTTFLFNTSISFGHGIVVTPDNRFAYFGSVSTNQVVAVSIDANSGVLTAVPGSPFVTGGIAFTSGPDGTPGTVDDCTGLILAATNTHLYAFSACSEDMATFSIAADGSLVKVGNNLPLNVYPDDMKITPDGKFLAVSAATSRFAVGNAAVEMFTIGPDGTLSAVPGSPFQSANQVGGALDINCSNQLFRIAESFTSNTSAAFVEAFNIGADGVLSPITGSPFAAGSSAEGLTLAQNGKMLIVSNGDPSVSTFSVSSDGTLASAGTLTIPTSGFSSGPVLLTTDSTGTFVYSSVFGILGFSSTNGAIVAINVTLPGPDGIVGTSDDILSAAFAGSIAAYPTPVCHTTPTVNAISPTSGSTAGGTVVTISGTNFSTVAGATTVTFAGKSATNVNCASSTSCTATSPAGTGTVDVQVTAGGATSAATPADRFTYVDTTPPVITISSPVNNGTYSLKQVVGSNYNCTDDSGVPPSCIGPVPSGSAFDTASVGTKNFTVTSADGSGNTSTLTSTYTVGYNICLLYNPNRARRAGSKFKFVIELCDAAGKDVSSRSIVVSAVSITAVATNQMFPIDDSLDNDPDDVNFHFEGSLGVSGAYKYNLNTKGLRPGTYTLSFRAGADPTLHNLLFQLR